MDIPSISQPTPLSVNAPVPPSDGTQQQSGGDTLLDRPKKKPRKQVPKLTALDLTQSSAISSLVNIGRATSEEYVKSCERAKQKARAKAKANGQNDVVDIGSDVQARMLETVLRRAARWAAGIAPQHSLAQFVMEARAVSAKRDVRSYISNVRLAQLRGADIDAGGAAADGQDGDGDDGDTAANANGNGSRGIIRTGELSVRAMLANDAGDVDDGGRHGAGVTADMPDMMMDDIPDMNDVPQASGSNGIGGATGRGPPEAEDDGWDEPEDILMDDMPMNSMPMPMPMSMPKPMPAKVAAREDATAGEQDKDGKGETTGGANTAPGPASEPAEAKAGAATAEAGNDKEGEAAKTVDAGVDGAAAEAEAATKSVEVSEKTTGSAEPREADTLSKATEGG